MANYDEYYARKSYDTIALQQPHIHFTGLFYLNDQYLILCDSAVDTLLTTKGEPLLKWIGRHKIIGTPPLQLVNFLPSNAIKVPSRTIEEIALSVGEPLTLSDIERLLLFQLPHDFPFFTLKSIPPKLIFTFERRLTEEENNLLFLAHDSLQDTLEPEVIVNEKLPKNSPYLSINRRLLGHTLELLNSRYISFHHPGSSQIIKTSVEEDEDFWVDTNHRLFCTNLNDPTSLIYPEFNSPESACFIDASVQKPGNIRAYLTLFQRVIISLPLAENVGNTLAGLNITKRDLLELVKKGRIQAVLPQSIDRYDLGFVSSIIEANRSGTMLSRRLAASSIAAIRKRMPMLYPPLGALERNELLNTIAKICQNDPGNVFFNAMKNKLGEAWLNMVTNLNARGAMAISSHGITPLLSDMLEQIHGVDRFLEVFFSTMPLEWAMGLNATLIPNSILQNDYANMAAHLYSPTEKKERVLPNPNLDTLLSDLYMLDNDCPISEIEPFCKKSITDRFLSIIQSSPNEDCTNRVNAEVSRINKEILQYESDKKRLAKYELLGSFLALGSWKLPAEYENLNYIPLALFVAGAIFNHDNILPQNVCDWLRSVATLTPRDSIFIGRIRKGQN